MSHTAMHEAWKKIFFTWSILFCQCRYVVSATSHKFSVSFEAGKFVTGSEPLTASQTFFVEFIPYTQTGVVICFWNHENPLSIISEPPKTDESYWNTSTSRLHMSFMYWLDGLQEETCTEDPFDQLSQLFRCSSSDSRNTFHISIKLPLASTMYSWILEP